MSDSSISFSEASNPACVPVNKWRWFLHYPIWPIVWLLPIVTSALLLVVFGHQYEQSKVIQVLIGVALLLSFGAVKIYWLRVANHFANGDALPGIVVALSPVRIAVWTDLGTGIGGSFPAVKVVTVNLKRIMGQKPALGQGLAMAALYSGDAKAPSWKDFDPRPIESATTEAGSISAVLESFTQEDWDRVQRAAASLPSHSPGLYRTR